ncbi:MAG TPA: NADH-quinone oxidoreductase subunit J [Puia sp.]|uniref:NADH-quinone oxidoreductase subunit J family protein n=1 Tax=Puia sp. TaxID=2045100 RepID=UPI002BAF715E|nr:NADH-quinone oxidoreductase subunit J [Puia sp.]HVU93852.1 NADH-quinone oxidoreductase subunit J [Puia sp.]
MIGSELVFYILSAFILVTGGLAVTTRKIFRSAIWLLFCLTGIAGLYFWLGMLFIAAVQIVVYVGGVVVLIIFSIFLTQQAGKDLPPPIRSRAILSALAVCIGFVLTCILLRQHSFGVATNPDLADHASIAAIGTQLLDTSEHGYALPFEVISLLLLAALIACIVLAIRSKPEEK